MISTTELILIAHDRLKDAETLLNAQRFDGAVYLCRYAIEIALKYKICKTLNWHAFLSSNKDFENYKSLKTHDLDVLLSFTGIETEIKASTFRSGQLSNYGIRTPVITQAER
jgi:hypothetical protein